MARKPTSFLVFLFQRTSAWQLLSDEASFFFFSSLLFLTRFPFISNYHVLHQVILHLTRLLFPRGRGWRGGGGGWKCTRYVTVSQYTFAFFFALTHTWPAFACARLIIIRSSVREWNRVNLWVISFETIGLLFASVSASAVTRNLQVWEWVTFTFHWNLRR